MLERMFFDLRYKPLVFIKSHRQFQAAKQTLAKYFLSRQSSHHVSILGRDTADAEAPAQAGDQLEGFFCVLSF